MVGEDRFAEFAVHCVTVFVDSRLSVLGDKLVEANILHIVWSLRVECVDQVVLKDVCGIGIVLPHFHELGVIEESPFPLLWPRRVDPLDGLGLATQVVSEKEIAGLVETALPGAQAAYTEREQLAVYGGVRGDLLPEFLHVAPLRLGHVASDVLGNCQRRLADIL